MVYVVVTVGVTIGEPLEYVYVEAPLGFKVNDPPGQTEPPLTLSVGVV